MHTIEGLNELNSTLARLDRSHIRQARLDLEQLASEMKQQLAEQKIDAQTALACQQAIARHGLTIRQHLVPALDEFATMCFSIAGKDAVRVACAPITREGTGHDGKPLASIPSGFEMPDVF